MIDPGDGRELNRNLLDLFTAMSSTGLLLPIALSHDLLTSDATQFLKYLYLIKYNQES